MGSPHEKPIVSQKDTQGGTLNAKESILLCCVILLSFIAMGMGSQELESRTVGFKS